MGAVAPADVEAGGVATNLSRHEPSHRATVKRVVTRFFRGELNRRGLKRCEVLRKLWPFEHHPVGSGSGFVSVKEETDGTTRLHRDHVRIEFPSDTHTDLLGAPARPRLDLARGEKKPQLPRNEDDTACNDNELRRSHTYS